MHDHMSNLVATVIEGDPYAYVISANIHRRHLTAEQKRDLIAKVLKATPDRSNRQIAETVKASHVTVGAVRATLESTGQIDQLKKTIGKDGKARKPPTKDPAVTAAADRAEARAQENQRRQASADRRKAEAQADKPPKDDEPGKPEDTEAEAQIEALVAAVRNEEILIAALERWCERDHPTREQKASKALRLIAPLVGTGPPAFIRLSNRWDEEKRDAGQVIAEIDLDLNPKATRRRRAAP